MIDAIATSLAGLQRAGTQAGQAATVIANPASYSSGVTDIVDIASNTGDATIQAAGELASGSLEAGIVGLKIAANLYKANAEVLSSILEAQKEAFEALV